MTDTEEKIYNVILSSKGLKGKEIAKILNMDKSDVNSILSHSSALNAAVYKDEDCLWHAKTAVFAAKPGLIIPAKKTAFKTTPVLKKRALPKSTLLWAEILENGEKYVLVDDYKEQDSAKGIFWIGRKQYHCIMNAILKGKNSFEFPDDPKTTYHILNFEKTDLFIKKISEFIDADAIAKTVYIYKTAFFEKAESVNALVYCANDMCVHCLTVFYSSGKYYLDYSTYTVFAKTWGLPFIELHLAPCEKHLGFKSLAEQSELYLYGYNVSKELGLETNERQHLLSRLMDSGLMSKGKIVSHISWLIKGHVGNPSMVDACDKWKEDLKFVNLYKPESQKHTISAIFKSAQK